MKMAILTSGILPVPAVQGGAVENLVDFYLAYNDQHRLHDITVYSVWHPGVEQHPARQSEVNHYVYIKVHTLWAKIRKRLYKLVHGETNYHYTIAYFFQQALSDIRRCHYDLILLENRPGYALQLGGNVTPRLVYHLHNDLLNSQTRQSTELYDAATRIITVSDYIASRVKTINPDDTKCVTVHNGIDLTAFSSGGQAAALRSKMGFMDDDFIMVFSGRLTREKGISELIDALHQLSAYSNIRLLVIGSPFYGNADNSDDFAKALQEKAAPLKDRIAFTGFVPYGQMPDYLSMADVAVVPSVWDDPFPTTVLEAQAMGLPIITTRRGGIPEEVTEENAVLLDTDDHFVDNLAAAILDLYLHPDKRSRMGQASRVHSTYYNKERYATDFFRNLFLFLFCFFTGIAMAGVGNKLSPWLQQAISQEQAAKRRAAEQQTERLTTTFLQFSEPLTDEQLAQYGAKRYAQLGDIAIVTVPLSQVEALAALNGVERIEANTLAHTTMDTVPTVSNVLPVYEATDRHPAFTGQGVVVGIMDIGFDLTHPNFFSDHYRIKAFWDQLAPDTDTDRFPVGRQWTTESELLAQGCATDARTQKHGTHTTGIAVGSGYDSPYRGIAFGSDLCLVANAVTADTAYIRTEDYYKYTSATDALGFKYLFDYAESQGKPCVLSFSEGYTAYMDDDDRLYSQFLSRLTGPGRILVTSAGNESQELTYFEKPLGVEAAGAFVRSFQKNASYRIQTDAPIDLTLYAYTGDQAISKTITLNGNETAKPVVDTLFVGSDTCAVTAVGYPSAFATGQTVYQLRLSANRIFQSLPKLALVLAGQGSQAALFGSSTSALANHATDTRWNSASYGRNVLAPGCFDTPITVGSTSHRIQFTNINGTLISNEREKEPGRLSWFSSTGPTMDGRIKPDVTAPGNYVISSLSSYYLEENPDDTEWDISHFDYNGRTYVWGAYSGTSMSTPVVAGTIALWLEAKPDLTRDDIIGVLRRTCRHPEPALTYPNNDYGYGEIDAYRGLLDILGATAIDGISQHQPRQVVVYAEDGLLHLLFNTESATPLRVAVYTTGGVLQYEQQLTPANREVTLPLPPLSSGIYVVQLTGDSQTTGSQLIRL